MLDCGKSLLTMDSHFGFKTPFSRGSTASKQPAVAYHYEAATAAIQLSKLGQKRASNRASKTTGKHSNFGLQTPYKIVCKSKRNLASKCYACRTCRETFAWLHEHLRASGHATHVATYLAVALALAVARNDWTNRGRTRQMVEDYNEHG